MLLIIATIMLALWMIGLATAHLMGGLLHIFLFVAIVIILFRVIKGRRPV